LILSSWNVLIPPAAAFAALECAVKIVVVVKELVHSVSNCLIECADA